jgi:hypothetical protein
VTVLPDKTPRQVLEDYIHTWLYDRMCESFRPPGGFEMADPDGDAELAGLDGLGLYARHVPSGDYFETDIWVSCTAVKPRSERDRERRDWEQAASMNGQRLSRDRPQACAQCERPATHRVTRTNALGTRVLDRLLCEPDARKAASATDTDVITTFVSTLEQEYSQQHERQA